MQRGFGVAVLKGQLLGNLRVHYRFAGRLHRNSSVPEGTSRPRPGGQAA